LKVENDLTGGGWVESSGQNSMQFTQGFTDQLNALGRANSLKTKGRAFKLGLVGGWLFGLGAVLQIVDSLFIYQKLRFSYSRQLWGHKKRPVAPAELGDYSVPRSGDRH
jgi:hypothetical protein